MATESELKLSLDPTDPAAVQHLRQHPLLAAPPKQRLLHNTYFDTADLALKRRKVAVRERRIESPDGKQKTLLTVKTVGKSHHGFSQRQEWEAPTLPGAFDFRSLVSDAVLADELCTLAPRLVPVFTTDFERLSWLVEIDGSRVEAALDRGEIRAHHHGQERRSPIFELELELKSGDLAAINILAAQLGTAVQLTPSDNSKAARGYALFRACDQPGGL